MATKSRLLSAIWGRLGVVGGRLNPTEPEVAGDLNYYSPARERKGREEEIRSNRTRRHRRNIPIGARRARRIRMQKDSRRINWGLL